MLLKSMVAGKFYPEDPKILRKSIVKMLNNAVDFSNLKVPKAIIAPHAGYVYSGLVAAAAYVCLSKAKIKQVVLLAPAHQYAVQGVATTAAEAYETPLGSVKIDQKTIAGLTIPFLNTVERAFKDEHSVEVHLPFLQILLNELLLIPLLVGQSNENQVEKLLENLWGSDETLIIISSDLSHYHSYKEAKILDEETAEAITQLDASAISIDNACGSIAIKGLLAVAAKKKMRVTQVDLCNSGDTSSSKDQVVGYGAFHFN
jgi:MEMO1 family protein